MTTPKSKTLFAQIVEASDKGLPPFAIAKLLGTKVSFVYVVRSKAKNAKKVNTDRWYQQHPNKYDKKPSLFSRLWAAFLVLKGS